jgi:hypothetical protein
MRQTESPHCSSKNAAEGKMPKQKILSQSRRDSSFPLQTKSRNFILHGKFGQPATPGPAASIALLRMANVPCGVTGKLFGLRGRAQNSVGRRE